MASLARMIYTGGCGMGPRSILAAAYSCALCTRGCRASEAVKVTWGEESVPAEQPHVSHQGQPPVAGVLPLSTLDSHQNPGKVAITSLEDGKEV